jgi:hypothetical protein
MYPSQSPPAPQSASSDTATSDPAFVETVEYWDLWSFEVLPGTGTDNSLESFTECSVGFITDRPSNVYELLVTLLQYLHRLLHPPLGYIFQRCLSE